MRHPAGPDPIWHRMGQRIGEFANAVKAAAAAAARHGAPRTVPRTSARPLTMQAAQRYGYHTA